MTWSEHWKIAEPDPALPLEARAIAAWLEEALAERGLASGPAIVHEGGELEGARIECFGRYLTIGLGVGDLRGAITVARAEGEEPAYAELSSHDLRGPWEPLYALFVELAAALGAAQEPVIAAAADVEELREDVRTAVGACVADALHAEGLSPGEVTAGAAAEGGGVDGAGGDGGGAGEGPPLDALEVAIELRADAVVARVTGAGERLVVVARGPAAGLSPGGREALERALRGELAPCVEPHRRARQQRLPPAADPARGGKLFLERREGGRVIAAEELLELAVLGRALAEHDVDVIRYFASGEPFWKVSYERGHELDALATSLDVLHADRTWQWQALELEPER